MLRYVLRRFAGAIPTLFVIITVAFFLMRAAPGGPFDKERKVPPEIEKALMVKYHLDEPLVDQFFRYMGGILQGDFGPSFRQKAFTVWELIEIGYPVSMTLGMIAMGLALVIGVSAGTYAALRQNTWADYTATGVAILGVCIPNFVVAPILTLVFGLMLGWLPVGGWGEGGFKLANATLPIVALALPQIATITRLARGSMLEVLRSNFVRTAYAKGLPRGLVMRRHTLKAAMVPIVSYLGPAIAGIITGSIVIEQIFSIPGIGRYFVQAAINRDYTLVMGVTILYGALIILLNLVADVLYSLLDPKVRYD